MKHYRYGKFRAGDYRGSWSSIAILLIMAIAGIQLDVSILLDIFPIAYAVVWLWAIFAPNQEQFVLSEDSITVFFWKKTDTILLPPELTLIVSCVDICPPLAVRTAFGNETHILKNKFAVSILQKMPLEVVLEALHRNYVRKYTTSMIQRVFDEYLFLYSFVCGQSLFDQLIANRKCLVIIPASLSEEITFDPGIVDVYIDPKC